MENGQISNSKFHAIDHETSHEAELILVISVKMDIACETMFLKELQKNKAIILTKENTRSARDKKRIAWMAIQQVLVATSGKEYSVQQLCKKWNNLQQRVKEKIRNNGTDKVTKTLHERDLLCLQIIGPENLNLPTGPLELNLGDLKPDLVFDEQEDCPVVVNVTNVGSNEPYDNKLIDVMINNHNSSPKHSNETQVLDLVMNNPELKNNLVTSLASLQSSLSSGNALQSTTSGILHGSPGSRSHPTDITLQDIDNIQTNIFTELANRISQINGTNSNELTVQLATSAEQLTSHLAPEHITTNQISGDQFTGRFASSPASGGMEVGEYNGNNVGEDFGRGLHAEAKSGPNFNHNNANKRKRRSSTLSTSTLGLEEAKSDILNLKREVLKLKKEKLLLKNEKTRLEIERLRGATLETRGSQTQSSSDSRDCGTQAPEPGLMESNLGY